MGCLIMDRYILLGGLLRRIGNFDNRSLETRIIFQKTVYFMQVFGITLSYNFSHYIYGPYSTDLAKDGYAIQNQLDSIKPVQFENQTDEDKFMKFQKFILPHASSSKWLEVAASLHILSKLENINNRQELMDEVRRRKKFVSQLFCEEVLNELESKELIKWSK